MRSDEGLEHPVLRVLPPLRPTTSPGTGDEEVDDIVAGFDSAGDDPDHVLAAGDQARQRLAARLEAGAED